MNMGTKCCKCCSDEKEEKEKDQSIAKIMGENWNIILSLVMLMAGIVASLTGLVLFQNQVIQIIWYVLAYLPVGIPVMKEGLENIKEKDYFNEYTLMTIATFGAFYIGEYPEAVAVMLFYSIGELFEDIAVDKAKRNISALLDVRPEKAMAERNGKFVTASPQSVAIGEIIEVKAGERVPLDGTMLSDVAAFNTSALTGESVPRNIRKEEEVLAGMIVTDKVVHIKVSRPFENSALARIIELVQNASERKAPAELFIRKFARIYTPIVIGLAVLIVLLPFIYSLISSDFQFIFNDWLYRGLIFLVISCPCALVVSIPLGYFGGIGAASRLGILFKGGNYLDAIAEINTVVFDKTGTLTKGDFEVQSCNPTSETDEKKLISVIASVEQNSTHPIAKAIGRFAEMNNVELIDVTDISEISGHGLVATIDGNSVMIGNLRLMSKYKIEVPKDNLSDYTTNVYCAYNNKYIGNLALSDTIKEDSQKAINELKQLGIKNIQMLSGDKQNIVSAFAKDLDITDAYGDLLPEGKVSHIESLCKTPGNKVAFVGDGINDAPVLALSNIGIAMGGLGSDVAIETADVVIQTDQPSKVALAIKAGKQTKKIVWQNVSLAFGVKIIVLIVGAFGMANLWEAVFADVGVTILAILNAIRIQGKIK